MGREDGFFYDVLNLPDGRRFPMRVRSMVGLIPLFAVETIDSDIVDRLPGIQAPDAVVPGEPGGFRGQRGDGHRRRTRRGASLSSIGSA